MLAIILKSTYWQSIVHNACSASKYTKCNTIITQCEVNKKESEFNTPSPITLKIVQHNLLNATPI